MDNSSEPDVIARTSSSTTNTPAKNRTTRLPYVSPVLGDVGRFPAPKKACANSRLPTKRRGEIAEAAFLLKAASLGFSVAKPWGESDRYDFILDNGHRTWRVQVKSSHCKGESGYSVHACGNCQNQVYSPNDIDFLVAYIVPEDVWYIVPVHVFAHIRAMRFFPSGKRGISRYEKYREAWCFMACPHDGVSRTELDIRLRCLPSGVVDAAAEKPFPCPRAAI